MWDCARIYAWDCVVKCYLIKINVTRIFMRLLGISLCLYFYTEQKKTLVTFIEHWIHSYSLIYLRFSALKNLTLQTKFNIVFKFEDLPPMSVQNLHPQHHRWRRPSSMSRMMTDTIDISCDKTDDFAIVAICHFRV